MKSAIGKNLRFKPFYHFKGVVPEMRGFLEGSENLLLDTNRGASLPLRGLPPRIPYPCKVAPLSPQNF